MAVFVLDKNKKPVMPCSEKRARQLLQRKRAVIHIYEPFTIHLKDRKQSDCKLQPIRLKLDPGSQTTGIALIQEEENVIYLGEIHHKKTIKRSLESRRNLRRGRRNRKTRYRPARFLNRKRKEKWLPPSLQARVDQTVHVCKQVRQRVPVTDVSSEWVKFDTHKMQKPEISGVEYQQGELQGYEVREYLLEKFNRTCAYCGAMDVPLEVEHVHPKSRGGSNRVSNLTLACRACNEEKGNHMLEEWLPLVAKSKKNINQQRAERIPKVEKQLKTPLKDSAMMNATRYALVRALQSMTLPVELGTGARTKMQRIQHDLPKTHYYDAVCVGKSTPTTLSLQTSYVQQFSATGRGNRQMARVDHYGFPLHHQDSEKYDKKGHRKGHKQRKKLCHGFQTGDLVKAQVTKGKKIGTYRGRVAIRHRGYFNIKQANSGQTIQGISYRDCQIIQRNNGWEYRKVRAVSSHD